MFDPNTALDEIQEFLAFVERVEFVRGHCDAHFNYAQLWSSPVAVKVPYYKGMDCREFSHRAMRALLEGFAEQCSDFSPEYFIRCLASHPEPGKELGLEELVPWLIDHSPTFKGVSSRAFVKAGIAHTVTREPLQAAESMRNTLKALRNLTPKYLKPTADAVKALEATLPALESLQPPAPQIAEIPSSVRRWSEGSPDPHEMTFIVISENHMVIKDLRKDLVGDVRPETPEIWNMAVCLIQSYPERLLYSSDISPQKV
tara:strand:+ start:24006 stop:24779 length:774 start_codon:yes stop_codon:yes gene_type:complete